MAGKTSHGPKRLILPGILSGLAPVRLQRNDLSGAEIALGVFFTVLVVFGGIAILVALRAALRKRLLHEAVTSTTTMTAMIFATI